MGSGAAGLAERDVEGNCILESFRECGVGTIYLHIYVFFLTEICIVFVRSSV